MPDFAEVFLTAGAAPLARRALVTVNAPTVVAASSRLSALSPEVVSSKISGASAGSTETIRLSSDRPITTVHVGQAGTAAHGLSRSIEVPPRRLALWRFDPSLNVHAVELTIGPPTADGKRLPVTCVVAQAAGGTR